MTNVEIQKVKFDDNKICVVPSLNYAMEVDCQYIYRSGMGVYWNSEGKNFYLKTSGTTTVEKQFAQILRAVNKELGFELIISEKTLWQNISEAEKNKIINWYENEKSN